MSRNSMMMMNEYVLRFIYTLLWYAKVVNDPWLESINKLRLEHGIS